MAFKFGSDSDNFDPAPEGTHLAKLIDVVPLGIKDGEWGPRESWRTVWALADEGKVYLASGFVDAKPGTTNLHPKSTLFRFFKALGFESDPSFEDSIGRVATVSIEHRRKADRIYANVVSVAGAPKGVTVEIDAGFYTPVAEREEQVSTASYDDDGVPL